MLHYINIYVYIHTKWDICNFSSLDDAIFGARVEVDLFHKTSSG